MGRGGASGGGLGLSLDTHYAAAVTSGDSSGASRRFLLHGSAAAGLAVIGTVSLSACGSDENSGSDSSSSAGPDHQVTLGAAEDVSVGGGHVYESHKVVVTQPSKGDFRAFNAVCTHQGCLVNKVADGQIVCPCHDSHFNAESGQVESGPADAPLSTVPLQVRNGKLVAGRDSPSRTPSRKSREKSDRNSRRRSGHSRS